MSNDDPGTMVFLHAELHSDRREVPPGTLLALIKISRYISMNVAPSRATFHP